MAHLRKCEEVTVAEGICERIKVVSDKKCEEVTVAEDICKRIKAVSEKRYHKCEAVWAGHARTQISVKMWILFSVN